MTKDGYSIFIPDSHKGIVPLNPEKDPVKVSDEIMEQAVKRPAEHHSIYWWYQRYNHCPQCGCGLPRPKLQYVGKDLICTCGNGHIYPHTPYEMLT